MNDLVQIPWLVATPVCSRSVPSPPMVRQLEQPRSEVQNNLNKIDVRKSTLAILFAFSQKM